VGPKGEVSVQRTLAHTDVEYIYTAESCISTAHQWSCAAIQKVHTTVMATTKLHKYSSLLHYIPTSVSVTVAQAGFLGLPYTQSRS